MTTKRQINVRPSGVEKKSGPLFLALFIALFAKVALASQNQKWAYNKFESGKTMNKTLYEGDDLLEAESLFENGRIRLSCRRTEKSNNRRIPDKYSFEEFDDDGRVAVEGTCVGPPLRPIDPYQWSSKPIVLRYGSEYCKHFTGTRKYYLKEGDLHSEENFKDGVIDGESTYQSTETIQKITYRKGLKIKLVETDTKSGTLMKSEEYYSDGSKK